MFEKLLLVSWSLRGLVPQGTDEPLPYEDSRDYGLIEASPVRTRSIPCEDKSKSVKPQLN